MSTQTSYCHYYYYYYYKYKSPPPADLFLNYFTFFSISACQHITKLKLCHHLQSSMATKIGLAHQYSFYSTIKEESSISILRRKNNLMIIFFSIIFYPQYVGKGPCRARVCSMPDVFCVSNK